MKRKWQLLKDPAVVSKDPIHVHPIHGDSGPFGIYTSLTHGNGVAYSKYTWYTTVPSTRRVSLMCR